VRTATQTRSAKRLLSILTPARESAGAAAIATPKGQEVGTPCKPQSLPRKEKKEEGDDRRKQEEDVEMEEEKKTKVVGKAEMQQTKQSDTNNKETAPASPPKLDFNTPFVFNAPAAKESAPAPFSFPPMKVPEKKVEETSEPSVPTPEKATVKPPVAVPFTFTAPITQTKITTPDTAKVEVNAKPFVFQPPKPVEVSPKVPSKPAEEEPKPPVVMPAKSVVQPFEFSVKPVSTQSAAKTVDVSLSSTTSAPVTALIPPASSVKADMDDSRSRALSASRDVLPLYTFTLPVLSGLVDTTNLTKEQCVEAAPYHFSTLVQ